MRSSVWLLSLLGIGGFAALMAQTPVSPPVRQRGATLLPPVPINPEDQAPIARAAADDSLPYSPSALANQPRPAPALWANGIDANVIPASGATPSPGNSATASSVPSNDDQSALSRGLDKLKGAFTGGNAAAADGRDQPNASSPFRGTAANGAMVYAGPPAYRWYGWGSVTPGANPYAPNGQYPKASANWYSITGATPGAFPVAVTNSPRMTGPEPPAYISAQSPASPNRPTPSLSLPLQQNISTNSRPAATPAALEQPRPSPLSPPDMKVWTTPPAPAAPSATKPEIQSPLAPPPPAAVAPASPPIVPVTPALPPPASLRDPLTAVVPPPPPSRDPLPANALSPIAPAAPANPDSVLPPPAMPRGMATPAPLPPMPTVPTVPPTVPTMPLTPAMPTMPAPALETQSGASLPVQPDKLPTLVVPPETSPEAQSPAALPTVPPAVGPIKEPEKEAGDPRAGTTGAPALPAPSMPAITPGTLPTSVTDNPLKWQPTNEQQSPGQWNSTGKVKPAAPAAQPPAAQPLPAKPPAAQPSKPPAELPPPDWREPGASDTNRPQAIARGLAPDNTPDPALMLIQRLCTGRAEGLDVRWTGSNRLSICFECHSSNEAKKLVQDICARTEFISYRIDFCVLVK